MKDDDSLPQKNVPYHDDRFIHRCQVRLYEDNQLYMLSSIYLLNIRRFYIFFFYTFTHAGLARKRKKKGKKYCYASVSSVKRERKMSSVSSCRRVEDFFSSWRHDHSLEHPVLKTSWLASKVRSSARHRRWERGQREEQYRTFLTSLRYQDLPFCSCDSRSTRHSFENIGLYVKWTWKTRHEENSSVSFFSSIVRIFSFLRNRIRQKINARKNILNIAW